MSSGNWLFRHSREGGNPVAPFWIPAFAGMTAVWLPHFPWVAGIRNRWKTSAALYWHSLAQVIEPCCYFSVINFGMTLIWDDSYGKLTKDKDEIKRKMRLTAKGLNAGSYRTRG
jgi:hypothetical protein